MFEFVHILPKTFHACFIVVIIDDEYTFLKMDGFSIIIIFSKNYFFFIKYVINYFILK